MTETEYWQQVAAWMGDCLAATAERQIGLKRESACEKRRHQEIAQIAVEALEGTSRPRPRKLTSVAARLRKMQPLAPETGR